MSGNRKKKRKWLWVLIVPVLVIVALGYFRMQNRARLTVATNIASFTAEMGTIEVTVTGTGSLTADTATQEIRILSGITPADVMKEEGDAVKAGEVIASLDGSLLGLIGTTQDNLQALDTQLAAAGTRNVSQYIKAAIEGRIKQVYTKAGDYVPDVMADSGALMILSIDGKMNVSFTPETTVLPAIGGIVTVTLPDGSRKEGEVLSLSPDLCVVTLDDKDPREGDNAVVSLADGTVFGTGILKINRPVAVTAITGVVESTLKGIDDYVAKGTSLIKLTETAPADNYEQLYWDRMEQAERLASLLRLARENNITSPFDGTVTEVLISSGKAAGTSADNDFLAFTVETSRTLRLVVAVDEQDILQLAPGQAAAITLSALPGKTLAGTITEIADEGVPGQDVTAYDVTIDFSGGDLLKAGMNASAEIVTRRKEGIVIIPMEALQEASGKQFVYVGTSPDNTTLGEMRLVTTGISDGRMVEITQGLTAGEQVNYIYSNGTPAAAGIMSFGTRRLNNSNPGSSPASGN